MKPDAVSLEVFRHLLASAAEEMGVTLRRTAYSPNIKERLDFSCAVFDGEGALLAQAAHIPVHLGAMPASVEAALARFDRWREGDLAVLNDPYLGGTHLPDITMVSPVFAPRRGRARRGASRRPDFFIASRAHHADVGGMSPGSMPLSTELVQEGIIIPPIKLAAGGRLNEEALELVLRNVRTPLERQGDLRAQAAAHRIGADRLLEIAGRHGLAATLEHGKALIAYAERMARAAIGCLPPGTYAFEDFLDDGGGPDGAPGGTGAPVAIRVTVRAAGGSMEVDFAGTGPAVEGSLNAVPAIARSAVWYAVRGLVREDVPVNAGTFAPVAVKVPPGSILDPPPGSAVAGGNVETSQRIVDAVLGALGKAAPSLVPAASQGTMNNVTFGGRDPRGGAAFAYYETMGGGMGASAEGDGLSGVHVHMSNTRNTPVEALELAYPCRVREYRIRRGSGGAGRFRGGDGLVREVEFLAPVTLTVLSERRRFAPYGAAGGEPGAKGRNVLRRASGEEVELPGKLTLRLGPGDAIRIETPGGGGYGS
jgi:N-methylhydantoinase B